MSYTLHFSDNGDVVENTEAVPIPTLGEATNVAYEVSLATSTEVQIYDGPFSREHLVAAIFA